MLSQSQFQLSNQAMVCNRRRRAYAGLQIDDTARIMWVAEPIGNAQSATSPRWVLALGSTGSTEGLALPDALFVGIYSCWLVTTV